MNNWGIQKRVLRTDADLEEAIVDIKEDQSDTLQTIDTNLDAEVEEQLKTLDSAPGRKLYEEWMKEEDEKDKACMDRLLADQAVKKSLSDRYLNVMAAAANQSVQTIPNEVFTNFNKDDDQIEMERQYVLSGNLSKYW